MPKAIKHFHHQTPPPYFFKAFSGSFSKAPHHFPPSFAPLLITCFRSPITSLTSHCSSSQFRSTPPVCDADHPIASRTSVSVGGATTKGHSSGLRSWQRAARYLSSTARRTDGVKVNVSFFPSFLSVSVEVSHFVTLRLVLAPRMLA